MTVDTNLELPVPRAREHSAAERGGLPTVVAGGAAGLVACGALTTGVILAVQGHGAAGVAVIVAAALLIGIVSVISAGLAIIAPGEDRADRKADISLGAST